MGRVFMLGASGTIGQATVRALLRRGHEVVCLVRPEPGWVAGSTRPPLPHDWPALSCASVMPATPIPKRATAGAANDSTR